MPANSPDSDSNEVQTVGQLAFITGIQINEIRQDWIRTNEKLSKIEKDLTESRDQRIRHDLKEKELRDKINDLRENQQQSYDTMQRLRETDLKLQTQIRTVCWVAGAFGSVFLVVLAVYLEKVL
ncbi:MAG: hypothetical protein J7647_30875 [Cyanobacteria bacterium SBLK]|nr:hypothetical protein [Cyanobacteria bacterium SBLK]